MKGIFFVSKKSRPSQLLPTLVFAPIKNAEGQDSPETACKLYTDFVNSKNKINAVTC